MSEYKIQSEESTGCTAITTLVKYKQFHLTQQINSKYNYKSTPNVGHPQIPTQNKHKYLLALTF